MLIGGAGIVLVIVGSFLPWVVSGTVRRSSYAIVGILGRLGIGEDGPLGILIGAWPLIGVLCMTPIVAAALRWWLVAGVLAVVVAVPAGLLSFGVILATSGLAGGGIGETCHGKTGLQVGDSGVGDAEGEGLGGHGRVLGWACPCKGHGGRARSRATRSGRSRGSESDSRVEERRGVA